MHILADPELDRSPGAHFGVARRLAALPEGWLHVGRFSDIPSGACYREHCGDTWVWVTPEGTSGLAGFTLVLQDIATLNVAPTDNSLPANMTPPVIVTLWVFQNVLKPIAPIVYIEIKEGAGGAVEFRNADPDESGPIVIIVGQSVIWQNKTTRKLTVSNKKGLFATEPIPAGGQSKDIPFDQGMYQRAGGEPGKEVTIEFHHNTKLLPLDPQLTLKSDPYRSSYSPALAFRVDRVIKPEFKCEIERRLMCAGIGKKSPSQLVDISYDEWMAMTTPYQGQRAAVKPGAPTMTPMTQPPSRFALPPGFGATQFRVLSPQPAFVD
jgi:hypothetical protein